MLRSGPLEGREQRSAPDLTTVAAAMPRAVGAHKSRVSNAASRGLQVEGREQCSALAHARSEASGGGQPSPTLTHGKDPTHWALVADVHQQLLWGTSVHAPLR